MGSLASGLKVSSDISAMDRS